MAKENKIVKEVEEQIEESQAKKDFALIIEAYKKQNPAKYAAKKDELEKKLAKL